MLDLKFKMVIFINLEINNDCFTKNSYLSLKFLMHQLKNDKMKLSTILFITFFAINSNAQDNYQFIGKVVDEKKQRVNDVDIYLSSHNISCQVLSNGQFICENSVPFKPNDILLLHFNKTDISL